MVLFCPLGLHMEKYLPRTEVWGNQIHRKTDVLDFKTALGIVPALPFWQIRNIAHNPQLPVVMPLWVPPPLVWVGPCDFLVANKTK